MNSEFDPAASTSSNSSSPTPQSQFSPSPNPTNEPTREQFLVENLGVNQALYLLEERYPEEYGRIRPWAKRVIISEDNRTWQRDRTAPLCDVLALLRSAFSKSQPGTLDAFCESLAGESSEDREMMRPDYQPAVEDQERDAEFPLDAFPEVGRRLIEEIVQLLNVLVSMPAAVMLGLAAIALGRGLCVWSVFAQRAFGNLFVLVGAPTGSFKSIVYDFIMNVLHEFETHSRAHLRAKVRVAEERLKEIQKGIDELEATTATTEDESKTKIERLVALADEASKLEAHTKIGQFIVDDATNEAIGPIAEANNGIVASASPDSRSAIDLLCGKYRKPGSTAEDLFLKGFSGEPVRIARRDRPSIETRLFLSVNWLTQPQRVKELYSQEGFLDSGLLGRFLTHQVEAQPAPPDYEGKRIPAEVQEAFDARIRELLATYHQHRGEAFEIAAVPEARRILVDYGLEVHRMVLSFDSEQMKLLTVRLAELAWRIALGLHALEHGRQAHLQNLDEKSAKNAVRIVRWFFEKMKAILSVESEKKVDNKMAVALSKVNATVGGLTARDLARAYTKIFTDSDDASATLNALKDEGAIQKGKTKKGGPCFLRLDAPKS